MGQFLVHLSQRLRPSSVVNFSHFPLLLWNHWTEFNETWQEARTQHPLPSLCFSGGSEEQDGRTGLWLAETFSTSLLKLLNGIQRNLTGSKISDGRPGLWLAETFSTSPLKPLNGIQRNLTWSKISMSSTKFVFFGPIRKTRWPPWPLIGWDIFDFSSETTRRNSTKLDRKQDLNVLYQVCVFRADQKNKMAAPSSDWLRHFRLLLWNYSMEFNETWQVARSQRPLPSLCFYGTIEKTRWPPRPLIGWDIFDFSSETIEQNSTKLDRKQELNIPYQVCVFRADRKRWPHWPLIGWDIFNFSSETAERNSTKLDRKQDLRWPSWPLIGWDIFHFSSETAERNSTQLDMKQDLNVLYQVVFFGLIGKTRWPPWPLIGWNIFDFSSETTRRNSTKLDRKQDLNVLYQVCVFTGRSKKQDGHPGLWLAETFSTSPLKPLNGIQWNLTGSKILK